MSSHRTPECPLISLRNIGDNFVEVRSDKYQCYIQSCFEQGILPLTAYVFCFKFVEVIRQWEFPCSWWVAWFLCQKLSFWLTATRPEVQVKDFHPVIEIGDHILHCRKNMEDRQLWERNQGELREYVTKTIKSVLRLLNLNPLLIMAHWAWVTSVLKHVPYAVRVMKP
jgi:hypothetical protein